MVLVCEAIVFLFCVFRGDLQLNPLLINKCFKPTFNLLLKLNIKDIMLGPY